MAGLPSSRSLVLPVKTGGLVDSKSCNAEVTVCDGIDVAFIHVFKSTGNAYRAHFDAFCAATTGVPARRLLGWMRNNEKDFPGSSCDTDIACSSPGWHCYGMLREPLDRFLSAYHEVLKRWEIWKIKNRLQHQLPDDANMDAKMIWLEKVLELREGDQRLAGLILH